MGLQLAPENAAELLVRVANAARSLSQAEFFLYEARPSHSPEVAFVAPRSSEIWSHATDPGLTVFEDAKWVYTALRHAHIPLDILSEQQLAEGKFDQYKVLYVVGSHLHHRATLAVDAWVRKGGTLWTGASGLTRDEANQPNPAALKLLGLRERSLENWGSAPQYRATALEPLKEQNAPGGATFAWRGKPIAPHVGRERLTPQSAEGLASFADGSAALTRNRHDKGEAFVAGLWAGLSYSATVRREDFDMRSDFDPSLRDLIAAPALERKILRPAVPSDPLVEAIALQREGRQSIALINWAYQHQEAVQHKAVLQTLGQLRIELSGFRNAKKISSLRHGLLPWDGSAVILPGLEEIELLWVD